METHSPSYYLHKFMILSIGIGFFVWPFYGLFNPEKYIVERNGEVVETNLQNLLPVLIIGFLFTLLFTWMINNYYKVKMDNYGITILKIWKNFELRWDDIESINSIGWLGSGTFFRVKPKFGKTFYFLADKPDSSVKKFFSGIYRTKMAKFVASKKHELGI